MKVLVIHNQLAGMADDSIFDFVRKYASDGDSITIRTFAGKSSFSAMLEDVTDFDFVVACGGDGTVSRVCYETRYSGVPILPFPAGTANLLALNLLSPNEPNTLIKQVDAARTIDFDLGQVETEAGTFGFSIMAGCGYDHLIMSQAALNKQILGPAAYFSAAFTNPAPMKANFRLVIDGEPLETRGIGVLFTNFDKIQFDLTVSNHNSPTDGMLDVVILKTESAIELIPALFAKAVDKTGALSEQLGALEVYRGREVTVESAPRMFMEYDGEPTDVTTPFTVRCLPGATRLLVSAECYEHFGPED